MSIFWITVIVLGGMCIAGYLIYQDYKKNEAMIENIDENKGLCNGHCKHDEEEEDEISSDLTEYTIHSSYLNVAEGKLSSKFKVGEKIKEAYLLTNDTFTGWKHITVTGKDTTREAVEKIAEAYRVSVFSNLENIVSKRKSKSADELLSFLRNSETSFVKAQSWYPKEKILAVRFGSAELSFEVELRLR